MQTFIDPQTPRGHLSFEQLPRGIVKFPPQIVEAIARERVAHQVLWSTGDLILRAELDLLLKDGQGNWHLVVEKK